MSPQPASALRLVPSTPDEADAYWRLYSSSTVCEFMDLLPFTDPAEARRFLEGAEAARQERRLFRYSAYSGGDFLGTCCLYALSPHNRRASLGYALREDRWGRGWGTHVIRALEEVGTQEFSVHRLQATVLVDNHRSHRLLTWVGYVREGQLRHYEVWPGRGPVDLVLYAKVLTPPPSPQSSG